MPIPTWIRDLLGIRKDYVETKKAALEIAKLLDEQREREFLIRASMDDIKKYDPNTQLLLKTIAERRIKRYDQEHRGVMEIGLDDEGAEAAYTILDILETTSGLTRKKGQQSSTKG